MSKPPPRPLAPRVASLAPERAFMLVRADLPRTPPAAAFDRWTLPQLLTRWWPESAEIDLRVGGAYHLSWTRANWHLRGEFVSVERPRQLAFSWRWDHHPESTTVVKVTFEAGLVGGSTLLVRQGPYGDTPGAIELRQSHIDGWLFFLPRLETEFAPSTGARPSRATTAPVRSTAASSTARRPPAKSDRVSAG
ncbi:MAG TPA: SRPBCC domain-containing protein [Thermoplasmata archaeon]|nr:SRPBCC domain-containing protein [Thermoplasmata archaeon]